jgi:hypothetical protein
MDRLSSTLLRPNRASELLETTLPPCGQDLRAQQEQPVCEGAPRRVKGGSQRLPSGQMDFNSIENERLSFCEAMRDHKLMGSRAVRLM